MRKIYTYEKNGSSPVLDFFSETDKKSQDKFRYQIEYIKDEHNPLTEPNVKHFSTGKYRQLYELRIKASNRMIRVVFHSHDKDIILLHAFYKKDDKDTKKALETSLKRLRLVLDIESENNICKELVA